MAYIIQRTEPVIPGSDLVEQTLFFTGSEWTDNRRQAQRYRHQPALSLVSMLSVTVPVYCYTVVETSFSPHQQDCGVKP